MLNFTELNKQLEENERNKEDDFAGITYLYHVFYHQYNAWDIDFTKFTQEDVQDAIDLLTTEITYEDEEGEVLLSSRHPLSVMDVSSRMCIEFNNKAKRRVSSPFRFV